MTRQEIDTQITEYLDRLPHLAGLARQVVRDNDEQFMDYFRTIKQIVNQIDRLCDMPDGSAS